MRTLPALALLTFAVVTGCTDGGPAAPEAPETWAPVLAASTTSTFADNQIAPDLTAYDVNGVAIALSDYTGSYVLLEVGGGWCAPSQFIAPFLPVVEAALVGDGFSFVSVSVLIEDTTVQPSTAVFIQHWLDAFYGGAYHPVLHMDGDATLHQSWYDAAIEPHGGGIPMLFLLGPDGTVLGTRIGATSTAEELETWVRDEIAQGASPTVETIVGPTEAVTIGSPVVVTGTWSAPDDDPHTGVVDWGDGTSDPLVVNDDGTWSSPVHQYSEIGFYRIEATISDHLGGSDSAVLDDVLVVDPDGGFVVGVGTLVSPSGACIVCDDALARFRLLSRYRKGASTPSGDFVFRFESGAFTFESTSQDWLMVNQGGARAQVKGVGRIIDGPLAEDYPFELHFMAWLDDGNPDALTLQIWVDDEGSGEEQIYDSFGGMPLQSGNVLIQTGG